MTAAAAQEAGARPGVLRDRVVLVSGAHGGLGRAASIACARAGATVVLLGRKVPKLNRVYDAIAKDPAGLPEPVNYPFDLAGAEFADHAELAGRIGAQLGRLDGLLHCAAEFAGLTPLEHTDPGDFARALHVDLTARWWLTQACLPLLRDSGAGRVVFAVDPGPRAFPAYWGGYGVAQRGLEALVETLAAEQPGLAVHALHLPPLRTPLRARAYAADEDRLARDPAGFTGPCLDLLAGGGEGA